MLRDDFEIYYYSDMTFHASANHSHDNYEIYIFLDGDATIVIDESEYLLKPGDLYILSPNTPHHVNNKNNNITYQRFVFWLNDKYFEKIVKISEDYGYIKKLSDIKGYLNIYFDEISFNELKAKIFRLIEEINTNHFGRDTKIELCVFDLLLHLNRFKHEKDNIGLVSDSNLIYDNLLVYIENHLDEDLSLDKLANIFYVNKYYLSHLFKEYIGVSVHQYILKKRLAKCCDALMSDNLITEVYEVYGFRDYTSFYRAFKKEYGVSPKEFKNKMKQ